MRQISAEIGAVEHLPSKVAKFLTREITSGQLQPGERLPSENKLADRFGVSRNVIREAVSQLRADGIIQARQGVGAFVMAPEQRLAIRFNSEDLKNSANMEQLFELRTILETDAAGLAATRRDEESLIKIKRALDRMGGEERWEDGSIDADLTFHREIAKATGNEYIYTFVCFICEQIRRTIHIARYTNPLHELITINVAEHVEIYDALAAGDASKAREKMRVHIIGAADRAGASNNQKTGEQ
ncbi:MAG: FadR family transcriptional regulator [Moritella sp.]|uniref:FadR/GntR family transcriptional regulator n=1 Tax=Moritella sp. TaxID=78556 RepID=UPI002171C949|nr:FadR/GntR family transcriptional regulator [Moritella sp.]MBL1417573.1 FadR family transcriptional regulator [Moritella sp.]